MKPWKCSARASFDGSLATVAQVALDHAVPVAALVGGSEAGRREWSAIGVAGVHETGHADAEWWTSSDEVAAAIHALAVRGAPAGASTDAASETSFFGTSIGGRSETGRPSLESHSGRSGNFLISVKISAIWLWSRVSSSSRARATRSSPALRGGPVAGAHLR